MDPVERRRGLRLEIGGHRLVREEHELLDQAVGDVALERDDRLDRPGLVDDDFRLVEVEINRSAAAPRVVQNLKQLAHQLEHRDERARTAPISAGSRSVRMPLTAV